MSLSTRIAALERQLRPSTAEEDTRSPLEKWRDEWNALVAMTPEARTQWFAGVTAHARAEDLLKTVFNLHMGMPRDAWAAMPEAPKRRICKTMTAQVFAQRGNEPPAVQVDLGLQALAAMIEAIDSGATAPPMQLQSEGETQ